MRQTKERQKRDTVQDRGKRDKRKRHNTSWKNERKKKETEYDIDDSETKKETEYEIDERETRKRQSTRQTKERQERDTV